MVQIRNENARSKLVADFRGQPMLLVGVAAVLGIVVDRLLKVGAWGWPFACLLGAAWITQLYRLRSTPANAQNDSAIPRHSGFALLSLVAISMSIWHHHQWRLFPADHIGLQTIEETPTLMAIRGRLVDTPQSSQLPNAEATSASLSTIPLGVRTKFHLRVDSIRDQDLWVAATGLIKVQVNGHLLGLHAGDEVTAFGALSRVSQPMNPGQRRWGDRDRVSRILCRLDVSYPDCVTPLDVEESVDEWKTLEAIRYRAIASLHELRTNGLILLDRFVRAPRNLLAGALLLGARDRLERDRVEMFFHTGTIHLLAISGLHLGILTWCLFVLARSSRYRRLALIVLMAFSMLYCFLTGLRDPVLRAAVLVHVVCIGMIWRRKVLAYNALASAAMVVLVFRPAAAFQPGTQLSFLAVATMVWLGLNQTRPTLSPVDALIARSRSWFARWMQEVGFATKQLAMAGVMIWLVTLPLVMLHFHLVSTAALLLNVVLTLPITVSLLSGFLVMLTGAVATPFAKCSGYLCDRGLAFVEAVVQTAHGVPGAYNWTIGPTPMWCLVFYLGLLGGVLWRGGPKSDIAEGQSTADPTAAQLDLNAERTSTPWRTALLWLTTWLVFWWTIPVATTWAKQAFAKNDQLRCTFLSVGHGTCVVLELPGDRVLLYDCGRMGMPETGVSIVSEFLWHRRITHIDGVILSHADADHYNLLPGLLERFEVGQVFVSPVMFGSNSTGIDVLKAAIEEANIATRTLEAEDVMRFTDHGAGVVELHTLHPLESGVRGSDNANSIVIEIRYQGRKILLPGDLEPPGLQDVMSEVKRDCDVLMAPHHGSLRSLPAEFCDWCTPEVVVISGGQDHEELTQQKLAFDSSNCDVLHTAEVGAVTITISKGKLRTTSFRPVKGEPSREFR